MNTLTNTELTVELLDPVADRARFGPRYCTGGYVFQIHDRRHGPLLTGPTYPHEFNWFDGQGIPDAFNLAPLRDPASTGTTSLVIGVGTCDLERREVLEFCSWETEQVATPGGGAITYRTAHAFQGFDLSLVRTVTLENRTLHSETEIHNRGQRLLPVSWFPHPFYPQPSGDELLRTSLPIDMPGNDGYDLAPNGFIRRRALAPGHGGHYAALGVRAHERATFTQRHPALGLVTATTSYAPTFLPIWGNHETFSFEPFFERTLGAGQSDRWSVSYDF
ncbi:hypothetical protein [Occultella gossypii]|uniref:Aldose 1-epimerase n=1 Tax=Occultella gossypii TaxID=2800820 RepID=A0ABS7SB83_9MICO|nr:hypothetical protein [Occultella gossypii]MBZ2196929.1 hypothetical protein [Occultella gossypii]